MQSKSILLFLIYIILKNTYPVDMPAPEQKAPRDPSLGTQKNPGYSCMDIKKWGLYIIFAQLKI